MLELIDLFFGPPIYFRVRMPQHSGQYPAKEIEILIALGIINIFPLAMSQHQRLFIIISNAGHQIFFLLAADIGGVNFIIQLVPRFDIS